LFFLSNSTLFSSQEAFIGNERGTLKQELIGSIY